MTLPRRAESGRRARFVHLGDRLLAIGRIRAGVASVEKIADEYGVEPDEVAAWLETHAGDRMVTLDELRVPSGSPQIRRLAQRAQRLAALIAEAERSLRDLHQEYVLSIDASNEPFDSSKDLDEFSQWR